MMKGHFARPQRVARAAAVMGIVGALLLWSAVMPGVGASALAYDQHDVPRAAMAGLSRASDLHPQRARRQDTVATSMTTTSAPTTAASLPPASTTSDSDGNTVAEAESTSVLPTAVTSIDGQPPPTSSSTPHDPLLAIMPEFAFSMPAQVVVNGVNLALTTMLTIQLIFTIRYHYPLSKKNYCLQSASTLMLLISLSVHLHMVLRRLTEQSRGWPYMFSYIAVQIPPQDGSWTTVQESFYLLMRAASALLVHLTHIQFLTLLFPSALEARLILWMLGPLALAASGMEFTALSSDDDVKTSDLGDAIRNICNSTLFLLYGSGLLIWGLLVNRRRAWRTDGGTAAFGGGSLGLAAINTMISFVEIAYDRLWWLPDICWTLTIWQSWLGFWWWVGSGMGIGEVEDRAERQERKRKRQEKLRRKREREEKAREKAINGGGAGHAAVVAAASLGGNSSDAIKGGFRRIRQRLQGGDAATMSRRSNGAAQAGQSERDENVEVRHTERNEHDEPLQSVAIDSGHNDDALTAAGSGSHSSDTNPTTSGGATSSGQDGWLGSLSDFFGRHQPNFFRRRMRRLRLAHVAAARRAATEQTVLRDQVLNRQSGPQAPGLRTMVLENRNAPQSPPVGVSDLMSSGTQIRGSSRTNEAARRVSSSPSPGDMTQTPGLRHVSTDERRHEAQGLSGTRSPRRTHMSPVRTQRQSQSRRDAEWEDEEGDDDVNDDDSGDVDTDTASNLAHDGEAANQAADHTPSSWTFRGGLRGLRMRDHTTYD